MAANEVDNPEQPVREQFKKASLSNEEEASPPSDPLDTEKQDMEPGKTLPKKRSFEEVDKDSLKEQNDTCTVAGKQHTRKRSRDSTADVEEHEITKMRASDELVRDGTNGSAQRATPESQVEDDTKELSTEGLASPKTKRSRLQGLEPLETPDSTTKLVPGSGFANTSATSPFGAIIDSASKEPPQTSSSAFAASKFSALSNGPSGFGAVNKTSGGLFGKSSAEDSSSGVRSSDKNEASSKSVFGGSLGAKSAFSASSNGAQNGFGNSFSKSAGLASGFGGSAFGSLNQGPGLSSFASGKSTPATKPAKSFGASAEDDDAEDDAEEVDESGTKSPLPVGSGEEIKDERFYEQEVETGEEDEEVVFSSRAKLYSWATNGGGKKEWKERGLGVLKLNTKRGLDDGLIQPGGESAATKQSQARFLMRADGSHRVVLNTPIKKGIKVASASGGPPANGFLLFMGTIDGNNKLELLQIKLKQQHALELYNKVIDIQQEV